MRVFAFLLFFTIACVLSSRGDDRFGAIGRYSVEGNYQFGRIVPHNRKFTTPVTGFTHAFELSFYKQTLGEKAWQRKLKYPELGGSFVMAYNADQKVFGNVYMFMAVAKFWIVRSHYVDFYLRVGTGLAFAPTHYDPIDNSINRAIGSTLNSADQFRLGIDIKPCPQLHLTVGANLTHYSNAGTQLPNLGVNVPSFSVGLRYFPKVSKDLKYNRNKVPKPLKKNEVMMRFGIGYGEMQTPGGPKYPYYIGTINYARYTSIINKVLGGVCIEFNQGEYEYLEIQEIETKVSHTLHAMKFSLFAGDEIILGRVGLLFAAGGYVFNPTKGPPVYAKLGINYYLPDFGKDKSTRFFVGLSLKTHFLVAQYYEAGAGIAF